MGPETPGNIRRPLMVFLVSDVSALTHLTLNYSSHTPVCLLKTNSQFLFFPPFSSGDVGATPLPKSEAGVQKKSEHHDQIPHHESDASAPAIQPGTQPAALVTPL